MDVVRSHHEMSHIMYNASHARAPSKIKNSIFVICANQKILFSHPATKSLKVFAMVYII